MTTLTLSLFGHAKVNVFEIEAVWIGVALHGDTVFLGGIENSFHVIVEGIAAQDESPGGMRDNLSVGIFDCGEDAIGHGCAFKIHERVYRGDDYVELSQHVITARSSEPFFRISTSIPARRRMPGTRS